MDPASSSSAHCRGARSPAPYVGGGRARGTSRRARAERTLRHGSGSTRDRRADDARGRAATQLSGVRAGPRERSWMKSAKGRHDRAQRRDTGDARSRIEGGRPDRKARTSQRAGEPRRYFSDPKRTYENAAAGARAEHRGGRAAQTMQHRSDPSARGRARLILLEPPTRQKRGETATLSERERGIRRTGTLRCRQRDADGHSAAHRCVESIRIGRVGAGGLFHALHIGHPRAHPSRAPAPAHAGPSPGRREARRPRRREEHGPGRGRGSTRPVT